jgi:pyruvate formate lyase activating enzyme
MTTGIVFDIKRYAIHDGPGIRTTVFLKGCPAKCWWCHNPESQSTKSELIEKIASIDGIDIKEDELVGKVMSTRDVIKEIKKETIFADESGGGVTFSGGEPLMQHEFLSILLKECQNLQIHTALDTTGYADNYVFNQIIPFVDLFLFDIKIMDDGIHQIYTGVSNKNMLLNLDSLIDHKKEVILRYPLIPGYTDSEENISQIKSFISKRNKYLKRIDILPFHNLAQEKYKRFCKPDTFSGIKRPDKNMIDIIKTEFESAGMEVQIGG